MDTNCSMNGITIPLAQWYPMQYNLLLLWKCYIFGEDGAGWRGTVMAVSDSQNFLGCCGVRVLRRMEDTFCYFDFPLREKVVGTKNKIPVLCNRTFCDNGNKCYVSAQSKQRPLVPSAY